MSIIHDLVSRLAIAGEGIGDLCISGLDGGWNVGYRREDRRTEINIKRCPAILCIVVINACGPFQFTSVLIRELEFPG